MNLALAANASDRLWAGGMLAFAVGLPLLVLGSLRRHLHQLGPEGRRVQLRASEDEIELIQGGTTHVYPWEKVKQIRWTRTTMLIDVLGGTGPALPRRVIGGEAERFFRERAGKSVETRGRGRTYVIMFVWLCLIMAFGIAWEMMNATR
jgi:hypothetical protein